MTVPATPWLPLLPTAMVGSERKPVALHDGGGAMSAFVAQAAHAVERPSTQLLRAAAVIATCGLAGAHGRAWSAALPPPAAADTRHVLDEALTVARATQALAGEHARLHAELFVRLAQARLRLPPALLPRALELGRRSTALRAALIEVLGERGLWLATQNEEWRYAGGVGDDASDERRWHEGSIEQRRAFLRAERGRDPAAARQRLSAALSELPVKERAELVSELAVNLGRDDETLLDGLRADRGAAVRAVVLSLLIALPGAAHPRRAAERMSALLAEERHLLRKRWRIEAPAAAAADWAADNVEAARPKNESLGERAWWLYQLVRQVPLDWWTGHTGMNAAELVRWARGGDWGDALLRAWREVLGSAPVAAWSQALLADERIAQNAMDVATILALLPRELREQHWLQQLRERDVNLYQLLSQVLSSYAHAETLSAALSTRLIEVLAPLADSRRLQDDYSVRALLPDLVCCLHPSALERFEQLRFTSEESSSFAELRQTLTQITGIRRTLSTIKSASSP